MRQPRIAQTLGALALVVGGPSVTLKELSAPQGVSITDEPPSLDTANLGPFLNGEGPLNLPRSGEDRLVLIIPGGIDLADSLGNQTSVSLISAALQARVPIIIIHPFPRAVDEFLQQNFPSLTPDATTTLMLTHEAAKLSSQPLATYVAVDARGAQIVSDKALIEFARRTGVNGDALKTLFETNNNPRITSPDESEFFLIGRSASGWEEIAYKLCSQGKGVHQEVLRELLESGTDWERRREAAQGVLKYYAGLEAAPPHEPSNFVDNARGVLESIAGGRLSIQPVDIVGMMLEVDLRERPDVSAHFVISPSLSMLSPSPSPPINIEPFEIIIDGGNNAYFVHRALEAAAEKLGYGRYRVELQIDVLFSSPDTQVEDILMVSWEGVYGSTRNDLFLADSAVGESRALQALRLGLEEGREVAELFADNSPTPAAAVQNFPGLGSKIIALPGIDFSEHAYTIIEFSIPQCGPCLRAQPHLSTLDALPHVQTIVLVRPMRTEAAGEACKAFQSNVDKLRRSGYVINHRIEGIEEEIADGLGVNRFPTYFIVDRSGILRRVYEGTLPNEEMLSFN